MKQTHQPNPNLFSRIGTNLAWIGALLFPKKAKPAPPKPTTDASQLPAAEPASPAVTRAEPVEVTVKRPWVRLEKLPPAFWTVTSAFSMIVNIILMVALVIVARELFQLKYLVGDHLVKGLYANFIKMDQATIRATIPVEAEVPVQFTLPVKTATVVTLTENTPIRAASVTLTTGGLEIVNAPTNIILPAGTTLPINLDIVVPVDTTIPIRLDVAVDIPLQETELHEPFVGLQDVVRPFYWLLAPNVRQASDLPICRPMGWLCNWFFSAPPSGVK